MTDAGGATPEDATLLGLDMPQEMITRVAAAIRGVYPGLTSDEPNDVKAFLRVVRYWVTATLAQYEATGAGPSLDDKIAELRDEHQAQVEAAREKAERDAADQIHVKGAPS